jgi:hypothetical protein
MLTLAQRAKQNLSLATYAVADQTLQSFACDPTTPKDQYILRMMVKSPWSKGLQIPKELHWLSHTIARCVYQQNQLCVDHPFVYVTVRSGEVRSVTDDQWHGDGFSMRVPHAPEQNYIWTDVQPTEVLDQRFEFPEDFDPFKHNVHTFFQDRAGEQNIRVLKPKRLYQIDPYIVHRRPPVTAGTQRTFFRISFVPVEIEDDTCTQNPLLPVKHYGRPDIRDTLISY